MKERIVDLFNNWYVQDALVCALLLVLALLFRQLLRREFWRVAFGEVLRRPIMKVCLVILSLYLAIAVLDSLGYHPYLRDDAGEILRSPQGAALVDDRGLSLLDLLLTPLRRMQEKTYSAPLASRQFTKQAMVRDSGEVVRDYPPLRYPGRHLLGTDKVGNDVLYLALKGVRPGIVIGAVTTIIVVPFALILGVVAGFFGGWVDDLIQYVYTVLSSIPGVLLIVAFMIIFGQGLLQLCVVLGIRSWTGLCRVLRGETLKIREMEYIQACEAMGVSRWLIVVRHIIPNVMHIVLITAVLGFSGRVLAEAVLTYIGIGVGAATVSWGSMVSDAIQELAREPVIWWKLVAAFGFMFGLVLPANLLGDALRDALDPRLRTQ